MAPNFACMRNTAKRLATWMLPLLALTGCATTSYKPSGMTDQQVEQRLIELRQTCWHLRQGAHVTVTFFQGAIASDGKDMPPVTGYYYGFNKMSDMVSISPNPLTPFDRGEPYELRYISEITQLSDTAMETEPSNVVLRAVQNYFTVDSRDAERALLTQ